MTISTVQRLQLAIVFTAVHFLWILDQILSDLKRIPLVIARVFLYLIIITTFFRGFYLESKPHTIQNIPNILNPEASQVLGSAVSAIEYPILVNDIVVPEVSSKAVFVRDVINDRDLLRINSTEKLAPASTTKLMTALAAMEIYTLDDVLAIPTFCTEIEGQKNGFFAGDSYKVSELIKSMLVNSSADAACTLSLGKLSYTEFVELMNLKAKELGLKNSSFSNPVGLDGANGEHKSTAEDLYLLSLAARKNSFIKENVAVKETDIISELGTVNHIYNTNDLLWTIPGTVGIKTGRTIEAGEVLIYEYNAEGKNLIIIVMGSVDRFGDTAKILRWTLDSYSWEDLSQL